MTSFPWHCSQKVMFTSAMDDYVRAVRNAHRTADTRSQGSDSFYEEAFPAVREIAKEGGGNKDY